MSWQSHGRSHEYIAAILHSVAGLFDLFNLASNRDDVLDALPMLGTEEAAEYMVVFLLAGRVDEERQDRWFDTLAFYKTPTRVMISSLSVRGTRLQVKVTLCSDLNLLLSDLPGLHNQCPSFFLSWLCNPHQHFLPVQSRLSANARGIL